MYERRGWWTCALTAALLMAATAASAQHRPGSALNWAFGGAVHTVARVGQVAFVGGRFNAVAARHNVTGGFAVASSLTSQRALRAARVHGNVNAIVPDGAGGWFVGGNFTFVGQHRRPQIAHILVDGRVDPAWTGRVNGRVAAMALVGGTLYVGGEFTHAGAGAGGLMPDARVNVAAFAATDGALLPGGPSGADGVVTAMAASGGTLYAGGEFATFGGAARARLAAYDTQGNTVTPWNPSADAAVRAIVPSTDGSVVFVGGAFAQAGGAARAFVAQIDAATGLATAWNPGANDAVTALALAGTDGLRGRPLHPARGHRAQPRRRRRRGERRGAAVGSERRRHRAGVVSRGHHGLPRRRVPERGRTRAAACRGGRRRDRRGGARGIQRPTTPCA